VVCLAKKNRDSWARVGAWSFLAGLVIAVGAGILYPETSSGTVFILGILGILVGILNIGDREIIQFLVAALTFMVASTSLLGVFAVVPTLGPYVPAILNNIVVFVGPGAAVVALKALYNVSQEY